MKDNWLHARVHDPYANKTGEVIDWQPLAHALCDALVRYEDGSECWTSTHTLRSVREDGTPDNVPRQSRQEAIRENNERMVSDLTAIQARWKKDLASDRELGPTARALLHQMIDGALQETKKRSQ
jgi:hypothetical protein